VEKIYQLIRPGMRRALYRNAGRIWYPAGWSIEEHSHSWWQIFVVMSGSVFLQYNGETVHLSRGSVSILPSYVPHRIWAEEDYSQFGAELFDEEKHELVRLFAEHIHVPTVIEFREILHLCEETSELVMRNDQISFERFFAQTDTVLLRVLERVIAGPSVSFQRELEKYFADHSSGDTSLADAAEYMNLSMSHLERLTRRYYGCGVMTLSRRIRAQIACEMLSTTDLSVKEISRRVGFYDSSHFTRFFKTMTGRTPCEYRGL